MRISFGNFTINSTKNETSIKKPVLTSKNTEIDLEFGDKENCLLEQKTLQAVNSRKKSIWNINNDILFKLRKSLLERTGKGPNRKKSDRRMTFTLSNAPTAALPNRRFSIREGSVRRGSAFQKKPFLAEPELILLDETNLDTKSSLYTLPRLSQKNLDQVAMTPQPTLSLQGSKQIIESGDREEEDTIEEPLEKPKMKNNFELFEVLEQPSECERSELSKIKSRRSNEILSKENNNCFFEQTSKIQTRKHSTQKESRYSNQAGLDELSSLFKRGQVKTQPSRRKGNSQWRKGMKILDSIPQKTVKSVKNLRRNVSKEGSNRRAFKSSSKIVYKSSKKMKKKIKFKTLDANLLRKKRTKANGNKLKKKGKKDRSKFVSNKKDKGSNFTEKSETEINKNIILHLNSIKNYLNPTKGGIFERLSQNKSSKVRNRNTIGCTQKNYLKSNRLTNVLAKNLKEKIFFPEETTTSNQPKQRHKTMIISKKRKGLSNLCIKSLNFKVGKISAQEKQENENNPNAKQEVKSNKIPEEVTEEKNSGSFSTVNINIVNKETPCSSIRFRSKQNSQTRLLTRGNSPLKEIKKRSAEVFRSKKLSATLVFRANGPKNEKANTSKILENLFHQKEPKAQNRCSILKRGEFQHLFEKPKSEMVDAKKSFKIQRNG